ncbi:DUF4040 domain-containing protein [uncultured Algimonas sp.]|uniref:DUF4040 domain-containing protein n=1 Tax=uncultured Algimonas sp. TaxID=1547920 RepID=UPI002624B82E|nr:DUF4040 domain-containing protein [uncultured Algimonas sp.]
MILALPIQAVPTSPLISTLLLDLALLSLLVIVAFAIVRMRSLFAIVMLQGVFSLVAAAWFVTLDAVDVAFTEAAVGAGVSTVLMLAAILLAQRRTSYVPMKQQWGPLVAVLVAGAALLYAVPDLPAYGDADSPANAYVGTDYLARTAVEVDIPNVVTAVLASYRGYDTFGEVVVIFAAGLGVLLLLGFDGLAGTFRARVMGRRLSDPSAPSGVRKRDAGTEVVPRESDASGEGAT